ncbi:MAG: acyl transferase [Saprospiraceae bacterium]|nr:acyl transferase [Saprospiraceae bacterium]
MRSTLRERIVQVQPEAFNALALDVFRFQAVHNPLYNRYLELIGKKIQAVETVQEIPFLPIELFKTYDIQTGDWTPERIFSSSGTTGQTTSRHLLHDPDWYRMGARRAFARQYGPVENFCFLALLPSYLERNNSSLVFMAEDFISLSRYAQSGFYLYNMADLVKVLSDCVQNNIPTVLLGVSFALLDLAEAFPMPLEQVIVMETGGMKGRRAELTREQLHQVLRTAFQVQHIHSEYGMTELLSQAYSPGNGRFYPAPTMRVLAREAADPFAIRPWGQNGALNIIDLANVDTLSFIATDDLGRVAEDHSFEVTGRLDSSEIRGCNLMVE